MGGSVDVGVFVGIGVSVRVGVSVGVGVGLNVRVGVMGGEGLKTANTSPPIRTPTKTPIMKKPGKPMKSSPRRIVLTFV